MKLHTVASTAALAVSVCLSGAAFAAPTTTIHSNVHAYFGNAPRVKVTLENDSQVPLKLKAGTQEWTVQPGTGITVKVYEGQKIIAETASPNHAAGEVVAQVVSDLDGATIRIK